MQRAAHGYVRQQVPLRADALGQRGPVLGLGRMSSEGTL